MNAIVSKNETNEEESKELLALVKFNTFCATSLCAIVYSSFFCPLLQSFHTPPPLVFTLKGLTFCFSFCGLDRFTPKRSNVGPLLEKAYSVTGEGSVAGLVAVSAGQGLEHNGSQCRDTDDTVGLSLLLKE